MGSLFSSEPPRPTPAQVPSRSYFREPYDVPRPQPRTTSTNYSTTSYRSSAQATPQCSNFEPKTNERRSNLTPAVFKTQDADNWLTKSSPRLSNACTLIELNEESADYMRVYSLFRETAQKQLKIKKIQRVENPYLLACYILKREELNSRYGYQTQEENHFHGTKTKNVQAICTNNFNWRLHGDSLGNRFGKGVSFSPIANYSSHYCDNQTNCVNTMFLARVLVTNSIAGSKAMILPPNGYDTAMKGNGQVVVKFCDHEFYPEFIIYYTGSAIKNIKQRAD